MKYKRKKDFYRLSASEIDRQVLDSLGIPKSVSVDRFKKKVLPNIRYQTEIRGVSFDKKRQRHTKVYNAVDMINYVKRLIEEKKKSKH